MNHERIKAVPDLSYKITGSYQFKNKYLPDKSQSFNSSIQKTTIMNKIV